MQKRSKIKILKSEVTKYEDELGKILKDSNEAEKGWVNLDTLTVTKYRLNFLVTLQRITIKLIHSYRNYTEELERNSK